MKRIIGLFLIFLSVFFTNAQTTYFNHSYDIKSGYNSATSVAVINDGYVYIGQYVNTVKRQMVIAKTDLNGDTLWAKRYGMAPEIYYTGSCGGLVETMDGGFALCGTYMDSTGGQVDLLFVKFDSVGDTLWTKKYGGNKWDVGNGCVQLTDKSYILFGRTESYGNGQDDFYLIKIDSSGNQLWQKTYGATKNENGHYIEQTFDKGFILSGWTYSYGAGSYDGYVVKIDSNGNFQWQKTFGQLEGDWCYASQTSDSGFIISGTMTIGPFSDDQGFLAKLNKNGDKQWQKTYGWQYMDMFDIAAVELNDGSFVVAGSRRDSTSHINGWLMKVTPLGDSLWSRIFQSGSLSVVNYFWDLECTWDNGFIMVGAGLESTQDAWLVKVDSFGCLIPGCDTLGDTLSVLDFSLISETIIIAPNPFSHTTILTIQSDQLPTNTTYQLSIYNILGEMVRRISSTSKQITIQRDILPSGLYFFQVKAEQNDISTPWKVIGTGKLVIEW